MSTSAIISAIVSIGILWGGLTTCLTIAAKKK